MDLIHHFEKLSNFRDAGGMQTSDGHTMKTGVLFRSGELSRMTGLDSEKLRQFNIKLICDLRSPPESRKKRPRLLPDQSIQLVNIPLHDPATHDVSRKMAFKCLFARNGADQFQEFMRDYYSHIAFERTARIREVFLLLAKEGNLPALIHCTAGKDRTGLLAALLQLLAGVPYDLVRENYLQTNAYFKTRLDRFIKITRAVILLQASPERMRFIMMAHGEHLDAVHHAILQRHSSVENYLLEACEIDPEILRTLKNRLLSVS